MDIGIPVWSRHNYNCIAQHVESHDVYWIVSDFKFNNFDYDRIVNLQCTQELFLDNSMGYFGNVSRDFLESHHIETLGNHSLKVLDFMTSAFPNIKLIFWCLYKRTKANANSSYPRHLWYDAMKLRYQDNIIDIDSFTSPEAFHSQTIDEGGHPNKEGYILLDAMLK